MSLGKEATQPKALKRLKDEVIVLEAISPKHLEGRWYVEVQFIEGETEDGYEIGSYGMFVKTKKAALGACRIIDHTSPFRIIIEDLKPNVYHLKYGEDGATPDEEEEQLQTGLEQFFSHEVSEPQQT